MKEVTGECRFCGQSVIVVVPDDASDSLIKEEATLSCRCRDALAYQDDIQKKEAIEMAKTSAKGTTYELFHEEFPEVEALFNRSMDNLVQKKFKKISVAINDRTKATISFSKEAIKVEREDKHKQTRETDV